MHENNSIPSQYAQLASSVINQYDASLIFYQVKPVQVDKDDIQKFQSNTEEVARIVLPHRTLKELSAVLSKQINEMEANKGEDKTMAKLKKNS